MEISCNYEPATNNAGIHVFKVSAHTIPLALANAIARVLHEQDYLELVAIGAGAIYRATTALTITRILLADDGLDLTFSPRFDEFVVEGEILAGLLFEVDYRPLAN